MALSAALRPILALFEGRVQKLDVVGGGAIKIWNTSEHYFAVQDKLLDKWIIYNGSN